MKGAVGLLARARWAAHIRRFPVGGYLLGALGEQEREGFRHHLAGCTRCRRDVELLGGLPARMALLPGRAAVELHERLQADAHRRPVPEPRVVALRPLRRWVAVLALAAAVTGGAVFAPDSARPRSVSAELVAVAPVGPGRPEPAGTVLLSERSAGSRLRLRVDGLAGHAICRLVLVRRDGSREVQGRWSADSSGRVRLVVESSLPPRLVRSVLVETDQHRPLLQGRVSR